MSRSINNLRISSLAAVAVFAFALSADNASAQNWINPEIYDSGRTITGAHYDPFTGRIIVRTDKTKVRESYLDPNREQIDPGSYRNVNRYETDFDGARWHVTGTEWTSNGVRHGNLSRRRVGGISGPGGITEDRNEHVAFGVPNGTRTPQKQNSVNRNQTTRSWNSAKPSMTQGLRNGLQNAAGSFNPF